jgi:hypothetical protein
VAKAGRFSFMPRSAKPCQADRVLMTRSGHA